MALTKLAIAKFDSQREGHNNRNRRCATLMHPLDAVEGFLCRRDGGVVEIVGQSWVNRSSTSSLACPTDT
jgi:hypothetical protein